MSGQTVVLCALVVAYLYRLFTTSRLLKIYRAELKSSERRLANSQSLSDHYQSQLAEVGSILATPPHLIICAVRQFKAKCDLQHECYERMKGEQSRTMIALGEFVSVDRSISDDVTCLVEMVNGLKAGQKSLAESYDALRAKLLKAENDKAEAEHQRDRYRDFLNGIGCQIKEFNGTENGKTPTPLFADGFKLPDLQAVLDADPHHTGAIICAQCGLSDPRDHVGCTSHSCPERRNAYGKVPTPPAQCRHDRSVWNDTFARHECTSCGQTFTASEWDAFRHLMR